MSMNKVLILGNLGKDIEIRTTQTGKKVANLNIAVSEKFFDKSGESKEFTDWIQITLWGDMVDTHKELKKGQKVFIEGKLKPSKTEIDGKNYWSLNVVAQSIGYVKKDGELKPLPDTSHLKNAAEDDKYSEIPF